MWPQSSNFSRLRSCWGKGEFDDPCTTRWCAALSLCANGWLYVQQRQQRRCLYGHSEPREQLSRGRQSVVQRRTLRDYAILARARSVAKTPKFKELLAAELAPNADGKAPNAAEQEAFAYSIHQQMFEEVLVWATRFKAQRKRSLADGDLSNWISEAPSWFMVVDRKGIGVADANDPARYGAVAANILSQHPVLGDALKEGRSFRDIWLIRGTPMTVGVVPVLGAEQRPIGAVILGYRLTDAAARKDGQLVQSEVAYAISGRVSQSSSLPSAAEKQLEEALKTRLTGKDTANGIFTVQLGPVKYRAVWRKMAGYVSADAAVVILKSLDQTVSDATRSLIMIPIVMFVAVLIALGLVLLLVSRYFNDFGTIDQGVVEIIGGNNDYWFEIPGEGMPAKMAQNLNIMVCRLSGRPLPEEEDDMVQAQHWARDKMFVDSINPDELTGHANASETMGTTELASISNEMVRLVRDDETYQRKTFKDYVDALEQTGEPMEGLNLGIFVKQLEEHCGPTYCQVRVWRVRFLVEVEDGKAVLKPVPLD